MHCATYPPRTPLIPTFPHGYPQRRRLDGKEDRSRGVEESRSREKVYLLPPSPPETKATPPEAQPAPLSAATPPPYCVRTRLLARKRTYVLVSLRHRNAAPGGAARPRRRMPCSSVGTTPTARSRLAPSSPTPLPVMKRSSDEHPSSVSPVPRTPPNWPNRPASSPGNRRLRSRLVGTSPAGPSTLEKTLGRLRRALRSAPRHDLQSDCAQKSGSLLLELRRSPRGRSLTRAILPGD